MLRRWALRSLLRALGLRLLDADGQALEQGGLALAKLARIDASGLDPRSRVDLRILLRTAISIFKSPGS